MSSKNKPHVIWPPHCKEGTAGHNIVYPLNNILSEWAGTKGNDLPVNSIKFIQKGLDRKTEHFGAFYPEVTTSDYVVNLELIREIAYCDLLIVAGQALSHCVAETVRQLIHSTDYAKHILLLSDCCDPVPGFENLAQSFCDEIRSLGANISTSGIKF